MMKLSFALSFACAAIRVSAITIRSGSELPSELADDAPRRVYPQYTIDLDLPPRQRWIHVVEAERHALVRRMEHLNQSFSCPVPGACAETANIMWDMIDNYNGLNNEQLEELRGIEEVVQHPVVSFKNLLVAQMAYELDTRAGCTGILVATPTGEMVHGRALDYGPGKDGMQFRYGLVHVTFNRGGVPLMTSVVQIGQIGIHTGMRLGAYGFEENTHLANPDVQKHHLEEARDGAVTYAPFVRTLMEETSDFEEAVARLAAQRFIRPHYFVLSGAGKYQGAIVKSERNATGSVSRMAEGGDWLAVQGNEDENRMSAARSFARLIGRDKVTPDTMLQAMQKGPVLNKDTQFIYVMSPAHKEWLLWDALNTPDANITRSTEHQGAMRVPSASSRELWRHF